MTVKSWGKGRPDYTGEQNYVKRAEVIKELNLKTNETEKLFVAVWTDRSSLFSWVKPPMAPGEEQTLIDASTGIADVYVVPAGYELKIDRLWASVNQPSYAYNYLDGILVSNIYLAAGGVYFEQEIGEATTKLLDPTFSSSHLFEIKATNAGDEHLYGTAEILCRLIDHMSEPYEIDTKTVKCRICGEEKTVAYSSTEFICSKGHTTKFLIKNWGGK